MQDSFTHAQQVINMKNHTQILDSDRSLQCDICKQKLINETKYNCFEEQNKKNSGQEYQNEIMKNLITAYQISLQIDQMKNYNQLVFDSLRDQMKEQIEILKNNEIILKENQQFIDKNSNFSTGNKIQNKSLNFKEFKNKLKFQLTHNIIQKTIDTLIQSLKNQRCCNHYYPIMIKSFNLLNEWKHHSFNYNDTLLVAGSSQKLQMFLFSRGDFTITDEVTELQSEVDCLKFIPNKENYFVSGHYNWEIIMWKSSQKYKFNQIQVYKNQSSINCMNCTSNILAFGGFIGQLSIWNLEQSSLVLNYYNPGSKDYISSISLNLQGTQLICCLKMEYFIVYQLKNNSWEKVQKIIGFENVYSITQFEDHFLFFTSKNHSIILFQQIDGNYVTVQTINLKTVKHSYSGSGFEICQYKNGVACKHEKGLYFFTLKKHQQLLLDFKMQFYSSCFDGRLTNNQEYMIIQESNLLRVFKFVKGL